jgi:hypothetical protein
MKSLKQIICESISRDELIAHFDEHHRRRHDNPEVRDPVHGEGWMARNPRSLSSYYNGHPDEKNHFYNLRLDPNKLAALNGRNGEHLHVDREDSQWNHEFQKIKGRIKSEGFHEKDPHTEHENGAMIKVLNTGEAVVHEGNKRTRASAQLGHKTIPTHWSWEGGSETKSGSPHPVDFMHDDDISALRMQVRAKRLGVS